MNEEDADLLRNYERMTWRTAISQRVDRFSALIADPAIFEKYFGEKYVEDLSDKIEHFSRFIFGLAVAYGVLMLSLYVSQDSKKTEFVIFGYGFKNLSYYKEFLLLATAISPISSTASAYRRYLVALRAECLKRLAPDPRVREFFSYTRVDSYFDPLIKTVEGTSRAHGLAKFVVALFLITLVLLFLGLMVASFLLQLNVIYDVAVHPASSKFVNLFVITFSLAAIALSWVIAAMQLPLPEVDLTFYAKMEEVRKISEARYKELLLATRRISSKRERIWSATVSAICFVICYVVIAILWRPSALQDLAVFVVEGMAGALVTTVLANGITAWVSGRLYRRFFRNHPTDTPDRLPAFARLGRGIGFLRVATPAALAVFFALLTLKS
jgi:hypothetical protein